jgi:hypothetical protein
VSRWQLSGAAVVLFLSLTGLLSIEKDDQSRRTASMRLMTAAIFVLALMMAPASAQSGGGKRNHGGDDKKTEAKPKVDDKAYKAALERIPEPKEKYDPWGIARPKSTTKPN